MKLGNAGLEFTAFPGKVKIVAERQKLEGGFPPEGTFLTSINAKKQKFASQKGCNWSRKIKLFVTFPTER